MSEWISILDKLPQPMSGYVALLHPCYKRPVVEFVGAHPHDFYHDGYTYWLPLPSAPE